MESEKVKEIKKGLGCCGMYKYDCEKCPYKNKGDDNDLTVNNGCGDLLLKDCLTLINELESENKVLKNKLGLYQGLLDEIGDKNLQLKDENERWQKDCSDIANHYQEMGKFYYEEVEKNQQLKDRIAELETLCNKTYEDLTKEIDRLEKENQKYHEVANDCQKIAFMGGVCDTKLALKQFAEKIWNIAKITVYATKHIVQGREYLHLDALKEIIKSCGVEIKE